MSKVSSAVMVAVSGFTTKVVGTSAITVIVVVSQMAP